MQPNTEATGAKAMLNRAAIAMDKEIKTLREELEHRSQMVKFLKREIRVVTDRIVERDLYAKSCRDRVLQEIKNSDFSALSMIYSWIITFTVIVAYLLGE